MALLRRGSRRGGGGGAGKDSKRGGGDAAPSPSPPERSDQSEPSEEVQSGRGGPPSSSTPSSPPPIAKGRGGGDAVAGKKGVGGGPTTLSPTGPSSQGESSSPGSKSTATASTAPSSPEESLSEPPPPPQTTSSAVTAPGARKKKRGKEKAEAEERGPHPYSPISSRRKERKKERRMARDASEGQQRQDQQCQDHHQQLLQPQLEQQQQQQQQQQKQKQQQNQQQPQGMGTAATMGEVAPVSDNARVADDDEHSDDHTVAHLEDEVSRLRARLAQSRRCSQEWFALSSRLDDVVEELEAAREDRMLRASFFGGTSPGRGGGLSPVGMFDVLGTASFGGSPLAGPVLSPRTESPPAAADSRPLELEWPVDSDQSPAKEGGRATKQSECLDLEEEPGRDPLGKEDGEETIIYQECERIEGELGQIPRFGLKWFALREELAELQIKLKENRNEGGRKINDDKPLEILIVQSAMSEDAGLEGGGQATRKEQQDHKQPQQQHLPSPTSPFRFRPISPVPHGSLSPIPYPSSNGSSLSPVPGTDCLSPYHSISGGSRSSGAGSSRRSDASHSYRKIMLGAARSKDEDDEEEKEGVDGGEGSDRTTLLDLRLRHCRALADLSRLPQFSKEWFDAKTLSLRLEGRIDEIEKAAAVATTAATDSGSSLGSASGGLERSGWTSVWSESEDEIEILSCTDELDRAMVTEALRRRPAAPVPSLEGDEDGEGEPTPGLEERGRKRSLPEEKTARTSAKMRDRGSLPARDRRVHAVRAIQQAWRRRLGRNGSLPGREDGDAGKAETYTCVDSSVFDAASGRGEDNREERQDYHAATIQAQWRDFRACRPTMSLRKRAARRWGLAPSGPSKQGNSSLWQRLVAPCCRLERHSPWQIFAAAVLQGLWMGHVARGLFRRKQTCALRIQAALRGAVRCRRYALLRQKCIVIQTMVRSRRCRCHYESQLENALLIQSFLRKRWMEHGKLYTDERDVLFHSATMGISLCHGRDGYVRVCSIVDEANVESGSLPIEREGTIAPGDIVIEAAGLDLRLPITRDKWCDMVKQIRSFPRPLKFVVVSARKREKIQLLDDLQFVLMRLKLLWRMHYDLKTTRASIVIQSHLRRWLAHSSYRRKAESVSLLAECNSMLEQLKALHAATMIQLNVRRWLVHALANRERKFSVSIQAFTRMGLQRRRYTQIVSSLCVIQGLVRGWIARRKLQNAAKLEEQILVLSIRLSQIQESSDEWTAVCDELQRLQDGLRMATTEMNSACLIQKWVRGWMVRRKRLHILDLSIQLSQIQESSAVWAETSRELHALQEELRFRRESDFSKNSDELMKKQGESHASCTNPSLEPATQQETCLDHGNSANSDELKLLAEPTAQTEPSLDRKHTANSDELNEIPSTCGERHHPLCEDRSLAETFARSLDHDHFAHGDELKENLSNSDCTGSSLFEPAARVGLRREIIEKNAQERNETQSTNESSSLNRTRAIPQHEQSVATSQTLHQGDVLQGPPNIDCGMTSSVAFLRKNFESNEAPIFPQNEVKEVKNIDLKEPPQAAIPDARSREILSPEDEGGSSTKADSDRSKVPTVASSGTKKKKSRRRRKKLTPEDKMRKLSTEVLRLSNQLKSLPKFSPEWTLAKVEMKQITDELEFLYAKSMEKGAQA
ncbi:hypothetical protein ACHAWF_018202 [Thalassiosira exigua]